LYFSYNKIPGIGSSEAGNIYITQKTEQRICTVLITTTENAEGYFTAYLQILKCKLSEDFSHEKSAMNLHFWNIPNTITPVRQ
jgi:hypothetical protein